MKYLISFLTVNLLFLSFCPIASAEGIEQPQTVEEAKGLGLDILKKIPGAAIGIWNSQAFPFLIKMWNWFKNLWNSSFGDQVKVWWEKIINWSGKETPDLESELQKEIQETQNNLPNVGDTLWERFQAFFK